MSTAHPLHHPLADVPPPEAPAHLDDPDPDPDDGDGGEAWDWGPRGTCPHCGSGQVWHLLIGLLPGPQVLPAWVVSVGCCPPPHDRECDACGLCWAADDHPGWSAGSDPATPPGA